jgi:hypothetical protein
MGRKKIIIIAPYRYGTRYAQPHLWWTDVGQRIHWSLASLTTVLTTRIQSIKALLTLIIAAVLNAIGIL